MYQAYDIPQRMWGLSVTSDQQAAGLIMKLAGGTYLWTIITVIFFRWAQIHERAQQQAGSCPSATCSPGTRCPRSSSDSVRRRPTSHGRRSPTAMPRRGRRRRRRAEVPVAVTAQAGPANVSMSVR